MASLSSKKLSSKNEDVLRSAHLFSLFFNGISVLCILVFRRPASWLAWLVFSLPSLGIQYILERNGRPTYEYEESNRRKLIRAGDDISRSGLYEYLFDVMYVTWFIDVLMILFGTNKVWWLYLVIPSYLLYMLSSFVLPWFKLQEKLPNDIAQEHVESKRQAKLQARKGKQVRIR